MKRKYFSLFAVIILVLLCLVVFASSTIPNNTIVKPKTSNYGDLTYDFSNDNLYANQNPSFDNPYNVRYESEYTENYTATNSFENDVVGNTPIGFNVLESGGSVRVIASENNHNKVLEMDDIGNSLEIYAEIEISEVNGSIEFWILLEQTDKNIYFYLEDDTVANAINLNWKDTGQLYYYDTAWNLINPYIANNWYHIRIDFECGAGAYLGLSANKFNIIINGESFGSYDTRGNPLEMDAIRFRSQSVDSGIYNIDAIGYSWDLQNHYTFDDRPLSSEFSNTVYPYTNWEYTPSGTTTAWFYNYLPISEQYLRLDDNDNNGMTILIDNWGENITEGIISFNFRVRAVNGDESGCRFDLSGITYSHPFKFQEGKLYYSAYPENITDIIDNEWYKITIHFDCISHLLDVYIDDIYIDSYEMYSEVDYLTKMYFNTGFSNEAKYDIDNLIYSFGYSIGNNMIPVKNYFNYYQTDNYQFTLNGVDTLIPIGTDNPLGWDDIESSGDVVNVVRQGWEGLIYIEASGSGEINGIEKTDFNINNTFIEIDIGLKFLTLTDPTGYTMIEVYSNDSTLILQLKITTSGLLQYYNGASFIELRNDIAINKDYWFNLFISYELSYCFLDFYSDDVFIESHGFSLIQSSKIGLKSIIIESYTFSVNQVYSLIDYIGIESDNYYPNEYSFVGIDLNEPYSIKNHNLLTLELNGNISIVASENIYYPLQNNALVVDKILFNESESYFTNTYDNYIETYDIGMLVFYLNSNFTLSSININGVLLIEGTNKYFPDYYYGNIDLDVSYWFVIGNNLMYFLNCDDNTTEYIEILFNINDITTYNYSFLFFSNNFNIFERELRLNYNGDTTSIISILYGNRFELVYLPSNKLLISIGILITDNNNYDDYSNSGYFSGFIARPYSESSIDITTTNFLEALIPLLFFMLLPTLLIVYSIDIKKYSNDETREKLFIPILAVFCIIAYAFGQIDLWMLFVSIIGFGTLFISSRGELS